MGMEGRTGMLLISHPPFLFLVILFMQKAYLCCAIQLISCRWDFDVCHLQRKGELPKLKFNIFEFRSRSKSTADRLTHPPPFTLPAMATSSTVKCANVPPLILFLVLLNGCFPSVQGVFYRNIPFRLDYFSNIVLHEIICKSKKKQFHSSYKSMEVPEQQQLVAAAEPPAEGADGGVGQLLDQIEGLAVKCTFK